MLLTADQLKALELSRNLAVTAGAGSGKTTVLVQRYLHALLANPDLEVSNILAITFTEKAAAEMKERVFAEIDRRFRTEGENRERLYRLMNQLHDAQISTIHGFCSQLLRRHSLEAGISPDFAVMDDLQNARFFSTVFRRFFLSYNLSADVDGEQKRKALGEFRLPVLQNILAASYNARFILRPLLENLAGISVGTLLRDWEQQFVEYHQPLLAPLMSSASFLDNLQQIVRWELPPGNNAEDLQRNIREGFEQLGKPDTPESARVQAMCRLLKLLTRVDGGAYQRVPGGKKAWGDEGVEILRGLSDQASAVASALLFDEGADPQRYAEIFRGLGLVIRDYLALMEKESRRVGTLDFEELQLAALALLQDHPDVLQRLQQKYRYILVDEFQDTDRLQNSIIQLLAGPADTGRLFVVGDPKQSIFSFRYADVRIFREIIREKSGQSAGVVELAQNFRSSSALIDFFNRTFEPVFAGETAYDVPFQKLEAARPQLEGEQSVIRLDLFYPPEDGMETDLVAAQVETLCDTLLNIVDTDSCLKLEGKGDGACLEKISYGDIALLLRSRNHLEALEEGLRRRGIPYLTHKGAGFFQRQEVLDLFYMLQSLADEEDDFAAATFLRGNYVGLSDVTLFYLSRTSASGLWRRAELLLRYLQGQAGVEDVFNPDFSRFISENGLFPAVSDGEKLALAEVLQKRNAWLDLARRNRFTRLLDTLIEDLEIRAVLAAESDGEQKLANLEKFLAYAREFEDNTSGLLEDFLEAMNLQISGVSEEGEAILPATDKQRVNIITYHSAKGMEFPVVFLPFLERGFRLNNSVYLQPEAGLFSTVKGGGPAPFIAKWAALEEQLKIVAEEKRLFYVAATRARDHLFLLGSLGKNAAVKQPTYLAWLIDSLQIPVQESSGQQDIVGVKVIHHSQAAPPVSSEKKGVQQTAETFAAEIDWRYQFPVSESPAGQIYSATQLMLFRESRERYFRHFYLQDGETRPPFADPDLLDEPGGAVWGTTVHQLLQNFHHRPAEEDLGKINQLLIRLNLQAGAETDDYREKLLQMVSRFRQNSFAQRLAGLEQRVEFSIEMRIGDFVLRGILDRLFRNEAGCWEVLDFKTNRLKAEEIEAVAEKYELQMQAYALLVSGLHPGQKRYPVNLYFLDAMKNYRLEYDVAKIHKIREEVADLLREISREELHQLTTG